MFNIVKSTTKQLKEGFWFKGKKQQKKAHCQL